MLLFFTTLFFILFIMTLLESIVDTLIRVSIKKYPISPSKWWLPAIIGGIWFYLLMLYLK